MARLYHSASSDAVGRRCQRAYFYQYAMGLRDPKIAWADVAHYVSDRKADADGVYWWRDPAGIAAPITSRQRSTALGGAVHAKLESWYNSQVVGWHDEPGMIAGSGAMYLPIPDRCHRVLVESPIGDAAIVGTTDAHAPPVGFRVAGVLWAGYRDLAVSAPAELARLGINAPDGWCLIDHKSTSDVGRWALRGGTDTDDGALRVDFQANLYALATMVQFDLAELPARWVYYETKRRRYAEPRDTTITRADATAIVMAGCERSRRLDAIAREEDAAQNPLACGDYGGCPHHSSRGGPCHVRQSVGALIQARVSKKGPAIMLPAGIQAFTQPVPAAPNGAATAPAFAPPHEAPPPAAVQAVFAAQEPFTQAASVAPAASAPPPPPAEKKSRRNGAQATATAAPAITAPAVNTPMTPTATAPSTPTPAIAGIDPALVDTYTLQGNFAPVTITGHCKDVLTFVKLVRG